MKVTKVRFEQEEIDALDDIAKQNGVSRAQVIRLAVRGGLEKYLGGVRFVDELQSANIEKLLRVYGQEIEAIRSELHRLGANYNQEIRLRNIEAKLGDLERDRSTLYPGRTGVALYNSEKQKLNEERDKLMALYGKLDPKLLEQLMDRFEKAVGKLGEMLWRIAQ